MKKFSALIAYLTLPFLIFAGNVNDSLLAVLDTRLEKSGFYSQQKELRLATLRIQLGKTTSDSARFDICTQLFEGYRSYKYDSAYSYAGRMLMLADKIGDPNLIGKSRIALAFSCLSAGLYKEAAEISGTVDTSSLNNHAKADYFSFLSTLHLSLSDFAATGPYYQSYRKSSLEYCRRYVALLDSHRPEVLLAKTRISQLEDDYFRAVDYAEKYIHDKPADLHDFAIASSMLGFFYEVRTDTVKAIEHFARAAIADIEMAVKETTAIRQLAELLYLKGDIKHAYSYAMTALDDANFYNARQRKIEVGRTLPIIEAGRFEIIENQKNQLIVFSILISVLFLLVVVGSVIIFIQKSRLSSARSVILKQNADLLESNTQLHAIKDEISRQNTELVKINEKLKEVHRIKDEYIGYFFSVNSSYIEKMSEYQKMIARKLRNGQVDELMHQLTTSGIRKEKEDMFLLFDMIFMKLFPDFIDRYNKLFNETDRVEINHGGMLSPELRIFALIRLGITETERIARFLDYSLSTVKNYKTKAKNRSIIANELFEHKIMEIESVNT